MRSSRARNERKKKKNGKQSKEVNNDGRQKQRICRKLRTTLGQNAKKLRTKVKRTL